MLGLLTPTDPRWVDIAERDLPRLLSDHAHCELKAAQSALSLVGRYGGKVPALVAPLTELAHEEIEHFRQVEEHLAESGGELGIPEPDAYVVSLRKLAREDHGGQPALLDRLLIGALIEGRSCERFRLLSEHLSDHTLRPFYRELMASEAGHYRLFFRLAEEEFGHEAARSRFRVLAEREATVAACLPFGPTVHG